MTNVRCWYGEIKEEDDEVKDVGVMKSRRRISEAQEAGRAKVGCRLPFRKIDGGREQGWRFAPMTTPVQVSAVVIPVAYTHHSGPLSCHFGTFYSSYGPYSCHTGVS